MKRKYPKFTADELSARIDEYFEYIKGSYKRKRIPGKEAGKHNYMNVRDRNEERATFSGLAFFLGFSSMQNFDEYEQKGKFTYILRRGILRVAAVYEQRLHEHYTSGPIFALKSRGYDAKTTQQPASRSLNIKIIESGPEPAKNEKEINIEGIMPSVIQNIPMTNDQ